MDIRSFFRSKKSGVSEADFTNKISQYLFNIAAYFIVSWIVVSSLFYAPKNPSFFEGLILGMTGVVFVVLPYLHQRVHEWLCKTSITSYTLERRETKTWDWVFCFLIYLPAAAFFFYWTIMSSHMDGFSFGILCMAASYSSIFLPIWGVLIFCILINMTLPVTMFHVFGDAIQPSVVFLSIFGTFCICMLVLLAGSAQRARKKSETLAKELEASNAKLRNYSLQIEELAINKERNRMAREIHDSLGHYLTVVNVQIEAAKTIFNQKPDLAKEALDKAQSFTKQGLADLRNSIYTLRESPLKRKSLTEALESIVDEASKSGLSSRFELIADIRKLSEPAQFTLFRSAQEAVTNVHKHAQATSLHVCLDFSNPDKIKLFIRDDGVGCDPDTCGGGFGIIGISERVKLLKGDVKIISSKNAGFELKIEIPA